MFRLQLLFLAVLLGGAVFGQTIEFGELNEATLIGDQASYFIDESSKLSYDAVLNNTAEFTNEKVKVFGTPATEGTVWVYFEAQNSSNRDIWLDVHNSNLLNCKFFKIDGNNELVETYYGSALQAYGERGHDVHTLWFPLIDANDKETYRFLIRVKTTLAIELPLYVGSQRSLYKNTTRDNWMAIAFIGGLIGLSVYNLFFFFSLKRGIYLFYSLNVISFLFVIPYFNNFPITNYIFGHNFSHLHTSTWIWIPFMTSALFASSYLELKRVAPRLRILLMTLVIYFILLIPLAIYFPSAALAKLYVLSTVLFYFTCLLIGYYMLFVKKQKRALLFCVGWTAMFLSIIVVILIRNGMIPYNLILRNSSYIGIFIELFVFAIAIAQYMNAIRSDQIKLNKALTESNKELVAVNDSLDSFNYHVSHDLKTVLNNTKALGNMAKKYNEKGDHKKVGEIIQKLQQVASNGVETVQSFLSLGKIDNLFNSEEMEELNLETEIERIIKTHQLTNKIKITISENVMTSVNMHAKAFESIFLNLFTNTIKYSDETPTAEIRFYLSKNKCCMEYRDYGIGIDMDKFGDVVFKPFKRAGNPTQSEGSGVGLYILNRIVTIYQGTCEMKSELGEGIQLTMYFPAENVAIP
ncbi:MAG: signal transduction histidine kinase [Crocinitomix sp.]|jgi:signal transduction histidine kinase